MVTAKQYRAKAAECTEGLKAAILPADIRELQNLEQSLLTLAENAEWMADNLEKTISPGADDGRYGDLLRPCQDKNALGCLGAADPMQSIELPTTIQQLFDDAGSKGGLSQTARLRWQIARILQKHKDEDFG